MSHDKELTKDEIITNWVIQTQQEATKHFNKIQEDQDAKARSERDWNSLMYLEESREVKRIGFVQGYLVAKRQQYYDIFKEG